MQKRKKKRTHLNGRGNVNLDIFVKGVWGGERVGGKKLSAINIKQSYRES